MNAGARPPVIVAVIIAGVALVWSLTGSQTGELQQPAGLARSQSPASGADADPGSAVEPPSRMVSEPDEVPLPEHLPSSLAGTTVPSGWQRVDASGDLVPTAELRQMFEYYLSALGEESLSQLVARIRQSLAALGEPARGQALDTLGAYLDYKLAVADLEAAYGSEAVLEPSQLRQRLDEIRALRKTWLDSATVDAFFAHDEAVDRFQLEKLRIARDHSLTGAERRQALARAEAGLPEPLRVAREETRRFADYETVRRELAEDPAALAAWRQETFGVEAASRLAALEREQQDWQQRWQAYSGDRTVLLSSGLAGPELKAALERLRARHFSDTEQVRARALDAIR